MIEKPISLQEIQQKINKHQYSTVDEFEADFELMAANAATFNEHGSAVHTNGEALRDAAKQQVGKYKQREENKPIMNEVLHELRTYKTKAGQVLGDWFDIEPSTEDYPEYAEVVKQPMSLTTAEQKVANNEVSTLQEFRDMVQLIFTNSKLFNHEDSQVYVDTEALEKVFHQKMDKVAKKDPLKLKIKSDSSTPKIRLSLKKEAPSTPGVSNDKVATPIEPEEDYDAEMIEDGEQDEGSEQEEEEEDEEAAREKARRDVVDKVLTRAPGKTLQDALINQVSLMSILPSTRMLNKELPTAAKDALQVCITASKQFAVQSKSFSVPSHHHTLNVQVLLNEHVTNRHYQVQLSLNQRKLTQLNPLASQWDSEETMPKCKYEMRLQPGLNQVEVACRASQPETRSAPQPQILSESLPSPAMDTEKFILWIMLAKA